MKKGIFSVIALVALMGTATQVSVLCEGIVPENDMYIPADAEGLVGGIDEQTFNDVIDQIESYYAPIIKEMGGTLKVKRLWDDGTVNASAQRFFSSWIVNMYGGLARHPQITADGFGLVMCHEIGHHIGGAPKVSNILMRWASNEGQSDYWGTLKCLRRVWQNDDNIEIVSNMRIDAFAASECQRSFSDQDRIAICMRAAMAGKSLAYLFQDLRNETELAEFDTPDPKVVGSTDNSHPGSQCRMDTYFQGALCSEQFARDVDQGKTDTATCYRNKGDRVGVRPLCWYKP